MKNIWVDTLSLLQAHEYNRVQWWSALGSRSVKAPKPTWTVKLRIITLCSIGTTLIIVALTNQFISSIAALVTLSVLVIYPQLTIYLVVSLMHHLNRGIGPAFGVGYVARLLHMINSQRLLLRAHMAKQAPKICSTPSLSCMHTAQLLQQI